ncbi:MAG: hypothetical protein ACRDHN_02410 [Thermomicrobiales bacterium]
MASVNGRQARLRAMAEDLALDLTHRALADKYGISMGQTQRDVATIRREWLASRNTTIEQARAVQGARLARFIREMWDAWFSSRGLQFKLQETQVPGELEQAPGIVIGGDGETIAELLTPGEPVTVRTVKQSWLSPGNPRFAEQILAAYEQLAKIQGLYTAQEVNLNVKQLVEAEAARLGLDPRRLMAEIDEIADEAWGRAGRG